MSNQITEITKGSRFQGLRAAYDAAFRQWVWQVGRLQSLTSAPNPDGTAVEEARRRVTRAETAYRESRNLLAEFMMATPSGLANSPSFAANSRPMAKSAPMPRTAAVSTKSQVERLAHLLWETSGRPGNSADADWRLAEQLITRTKQGPTA